jgi:hypothetical protein
VAISRKTVSYQPEKKGSPPIRLDAVGGARTENLRESLSEKVVGKRRSDLYPSG